jgi:hypothetical protein
MNRERALKIVLVVVGLLFTALVYPLVLFVKQGFNLCRVRPPASGTCMERSRQFFERGMARF